LTQSNSTIVAGDGFWHKSTASGTAPDDAGSVSLRLFVTAPAPPPDGGFANSLFDNILALKL